MAKVIKLTDNNNNTLLPVTDASYIQLSYDGVTKSVKDVIIENEEVTAAALTELHQEVGICFNEAGSGLSRSGNTINHASTVTAQTFGPAVGKTLNFGDTFTIPKITINNTGHITGKSMITYTMPSAPENSHLYSQLYVMPSHLNSFNDDPIGEEFGSYNGISGNSYTYLSLYEGDNDSGLYRRSSVWVTGTGSTIVTGQISGWDTKLSINTVPNLFVGEASGISSNGTSINLEIPEVFNKLLNEPSDIPIGTMFSITFNDCEPSDSNLILGGISDGSPYYSTCMVVDGPGNEITDLTSPLLGYCPDSTITNLYTFTGMYDDKGVLQYITNSNVHTEIEQKTSVVHFSSFTEMTNNITSYSHGTIAIIDDNETNHPFIKFNYCEGHGGECRSKWIPLETTADNKHRMKFEIDTSTARISYGISQPAQFGIGDEILIPTFTESVKASTSSYGFAKYDSTPTSGSENALTSGGAYTALYNITSNPVQSSYYAYQLYKYSGNSNWDFPLALSGVDTGANNNGANHTDQFREFAWCQDIKYNVRTQTLKLGYLYDSSAGVTIAPAEYVELKRDRLQFHTPNEIAGDEKYITSSQYTGNSATSTKGLSIHKAVCNTAGGTAAKTCSIANYTLDSAKIIAVRFTNGNTIANPTLNVSSKGAKAIYYHGKRVTNDYIGNILLKAGATVIFEYDGTNYNIITDSYESDLSILKYTVKNASSNAVTFTTSSKMLPNTVYVVGSGSNPFSFTAINSVVLASGSTSFLANDIGILWNAGQASNITNGMTVPMYQMLFKAGTAGVSFTMPSSIRWKDGSAPDVRSTSNKMCELTIINNIATINII